MHQLVTGVRMICTCDFTPDHITNGRWDCNSSDPTMVIFRADVVGTGTRESIADDIVDWAHTTNNIGVGRERLQVVGAITCLNHNCSTMSVAPTHHYYYYWIIGFITGTIVVLIIIAVIVATVLFWWRNLKKDKPVWWDSTKMNDWASYFYFATLSIEDSCQIHCVTRIKAQFPHCILISSPVLQLGWIQNQI